MVKNRLIILLLVLTSFAGSAQNRYMVFFKDKLGSPYTIQNPIEFLSEKSIERRIRQEIDVTQEDIPVSPVYIEGVKATGVEVFYATKWMNGVLVQCQSTSIPAIESLPYVDRVELVAPGVRLKSNGRRVFSNHKNGIVGEKTATQLGMLGIPEMHEDGYRGEGISIAIFDGGFVGVKTAAPFQHLFTEGRLSEELSFNFVRNDRDVFGYDDHGTNVLSVIAADIPGIYTGGAYKANFQLYITEDVPTEYRIEEYNWLFAAERADSAGVDIVNCSLGYNDFDGTSMDYTYEQMDGKTTVVTRAAQTLASKGVIVVVSAGNEGSIAWKKITAPADAKDVVAVANVNALGNRSSTSSMGPASDGTIKPDLAALGSGVSVIKPNGSVSTASGTSLSAPLITSLIAGVWQRYPDLSAKEVIHSLKMTASRAAKPDTLIGYGIPNYIALTKEPEVSNQQNLFEVYPTRTTDSLTISPIDPDQVPACDVEIMNSSGQILSSTRVEFTWLNNKYTSSISSLAAGLYFIRIHFQGEKYTFRIVKV